jgi:16S rRNA (uracil1498-N3)-methyltransferase
MQRIFTTEALTSGAIIELPQSQVNYLVNVLRLRPTDKIKLFNGRDGEWLASIVSYNKKTVTLGLERHLRPQIPEAGPKLIFAPIKPTRMAWLIEKATELGVSEFIPLEMQHSVIRSIKLDKWQRTSIEAAEQCERMTLPSFQPMIPLAKFCAELADNMKIILGDESGTGDKLSDVLNHLPVENDYAIMIGPEGGFSTDEIALLKSLQQVQMVGLGPRILRAETAAITLLACVQSTIGDWGIPPRYNR